MSRYPALVPTVASEPLITPARFRGQRVNLFSVNDRAIPRNSLKTVMASGEQTRRHKGCLDRIQSQYPPKPFVSERGKWAQYVLTNLFPDTKDRRLSSPAFLSYIVSHVDPNQTGNVNSQAEFTFVLLMDFQGQICFEHRVQLRKDHMSRR